ncbi:hypothetical protein ACFVQ3_11220 [Oerskovia sp. NPDC057915]|uniref:hypothetical protein n=1 Tax=Oerskovia sp. NPDC057915 TaxID=3346280 RepID=UPI0036DE707A
MIEKLGGDLSETERAFADELQRMSAAEVTAFVEELRRVEASLSSVEIWDPVVGVVVDGDSRELAVVRLIAGGPDVVARAVAAGRAEVGLGPEDDGAEEVIGIIAVAYERATGLSFAPPEGESHPGEVSAQMNEPRWWVLRARAHRGAAAACREIEQSQVLREFLLGHDRPNELFMVVEATTSDRHAHVYLQGSGIMALFGAPLSRGSAAEGRREVERCYDVLRERYGLPDVMGPIPPDSLPHRDG